MAGSMERGATGSLERDPAASPGGRWGHLETPARPVELNSVFPPSQVHEQLQGQEQQLDTHLLTDVVWSLCVLQQAQPPHLRQVLSPEFQARLRGEPRAAGQDRPSPALGSGMGRELQPRGWPGVTCDGCWAGAAQSNSVPVPPWRGPATGCHSDLRGHVPRVPSCGTRGVNPTGDMESGNAWGREGPLSCRSSPVPAALGTQTMSPVSNPHGC